MKTPYIVGISGGSASGKTYLLKKLMEAFSTEELCLVSQDNYYKPIHLQEQDHNKIYNFDLPDAIDREYFYKDLQRLKSEEVVTKEEYTFNNENKKPKILTFQPAPIIVVEGIFVFYFREISALIDLKIFVDAKEHVKLTRRIKRDSEERGYSLQDVLYRYEHHVAPNYERYIEPFKNDADLIIPNNSHMSNGMDVIITYLRTKFNNINHITT